MKGNKKKVFKKQSSPVVFLVHPLVYESGPCSFVARIRARGNLYARLNSLFKLRCPFLLPHFSANVPLPICRLSFIYNYVLPERDFYFWRSFKLWSSKFSSFFKGGLVWSGGQSLLSITCDTWDEEVKWFPAAYSLFGCCWRQIEPQIKPFCGQIVLGFFKCWRCLAKKSSRQ